MGSAEGAVDVEVTSAAEDSAWLVSSAVVSGAAEDVEDVMAEELSSVEDMMEVEMELELVRLDVVTVMKSELAGKEEVEKEDMAAVVVKVSWVIERDGRHTGRVGHGGKCK